MNAILIDGNSLMYRAYYATAFGSIMTSSKGLATNCIYAFYNMMNKLNLDKYDYALIAFDYGKKTLRHEKLESYKGGRKPMPDELRMQVPYVKKLSSILGLKVYEQELVEADDIVGTMSRKFHEIGVPVTIYSGDKDLLQLVNDNARVCFTKKGVSDILEYNNENFKELHHVYPNQVIDLKGLTGDKSDNLPGISGIGEKTAWQLLEEYGTLENVILNADKMTKSRREHILADKDQALLTKELATINIYSDIPVTTQDTIYKGIDTSALYELFTELEFTSLLSRLPKPEKKNEEDFSYEVLTKDNLDIINSFDESTFILEYFDTNYHKAKLLGLSIKSNKTYFVPTKLLTSPEVKKYFLEAKKYTYDLKSSIVLLDKLGLKIDNVIYDLMLLAYIIDADTKDTLYDLALKYSVNLDNTESCYGKGVKRGIPSDENIYMKYACLEVTALDNIKDQLLDLVNDDINNLYHLEHQLSYVLASMEITGVSVDVDVLNKLKAEFNSTLDSLEVEIYLEAGTRFNINSPKQLGTVLFEDLELPYPKKHKEGSSYSTSADILEKLKAVPIVSKILEYRKISKLVSTYLEGMENVLIDGKVHTIYKQALTTTGRLSSTEPNMQNIPIRSEEGRSIRKIFVTDKTFIGLDYSQIELRVLAHLSEDENMCQGFINGDDIHRMTAAKVNKKPMEEVTKLERSMAKAVNFGIVYGQTAFGLSEELNISVASAKKFIDDYYEHYPRIRTYLDSLVELAKEKGYAETFMKRRRYLNDINSSNYFLREFATRTALNTPIQGSAADIIKIAMVNLYTALNELGLKSKIVLQIHDELIIEVADGELEIVSKLAKEKMENAVKLKVPLIVDFNEANNLYDLK